MSRDVARAALYRGIINLWVQDELSREYLSAVWNSPPDVFFLIGGGNEGVGAVVKDAESAGFPNVFGLIDRDFRPTNRSNRKTPNKTFRVFVLPVHEIENYLLDPEALAESRLNNLKRTAVAIDGHLTAAARRLTWWAACREVVAELKDRFRNEFIPDPPRGGIVNESSAVNHVCNSDWFGKLRREVDRTSRDDVRNLLAAAHAAAETSVAVGQWRSEFAGKEIYRDVGSRICDRQAPSLGRYRPTQVEFDIDLARDVAAWQVTQNRVPSDLTELLEALRSRVAAATRLP